MSNAIGILMVDSQFDRLHGDIGNPSTWPFPVRYKVVTHATPATMVSLESNDVIQNFIQAADELMEEGVVGITTTCGFLGLYQPTLANHCAVPVATSSLLQVPIVECLIPKNKRVGILTYNASALTADHLQAVGVAADTPMVGFDSESMFYRWIMHGDKPADIELLRNDVLDAARTLKRNHPEVAAIVSECTNLTPFARDIRAVTGLPVYDMVSMMHWFRTGLEPLF